MLNLQTTGRLHLYLRNSFMGLLFVFVDGIGVGENSSGNPLSSDILGSFSFFTGMNGFHSDCESIVTDKKLYKPIDANLGVEGYPQSGTGQASLFTGINGSKFIGKHFGPYPHSRLKPLLKQESLFKKAVKAEKTSHFLNAYPEIFFEKSKKKNRWSCTTLMAKSAGLKLNGIDEVKKGTAITAEIVQSAWRNQLNLDVPEIEPEVASERAVLSLRRYDLVLYEYYLTDKAGHAQDREMADLVLLNLDRFINGIMNSMDQQDTLIITSDHGNIEDLTVKTHTRNPVPLMVYGETGQFQHAESILDITPAIINTLKMAGSV